jgi:hypothetical protein
VDHLDQLARDALVQLGRVQVHNLELALNVRVIEPEVEAAALECLRQLARVVGREQHQRVRASLDHAELWDRDLEVREHLEEHRLELLVGLVDLVDQQHHGLLRADGVQERPREQEVLAEDVVLDLLPASVGSLGLDAQQLLAVVPLVQRLRLVEALVALEPDQLALRGARDRLGELRLADPRGALHEHGLAEPPRQERHERGRLVGQIADLAEALVRVLDAVELVAHPARRILSPPCPPF